MGRIWIGMGLVLGLAISAIAAERAIAAEEAGKSEPGVTSKPTASGSVGRNVFSPPIRASNPLPGTSPSRTFATMPAASVAESPMRTPAEPVPVVPAKDGERRHTRTVLRLSSVPAIDVANTVNQLLSAEGKAAEAQALLRSVVIVPDMISNSLVIGGPSDAVEEVRQLVAELDHPAVMIQIEATIMEVPAEQTKSETGVSQPEGKKRQGKARLLAPGEMPEKGEVLVRVQLMTLDNQQAHVQMGRREPRITSSQTSQYGRVNSTTLENTGTILALTPKVSADQAVAMTVAVEDSRLGPLEEGVVISVPKEGEPIRSPKIDTAIVQTTVSIPDGQTALIAGMTREVKSGKERVVLITPRVLHINGEAKGVKK
jgi:type II secretory pathway component GspD/PulD (secretin)